jgi:hypothetical protein
MRLLCCYDTAVNLAALLAARFQLDADHGGRSSGGQLVAQHTGSTYVACLARQRVVVGHVLQQSRP